MKRVKRRKTVLDKEKYAIITLKRKRNIQQADPDRTQKIARVHPLIAITHYVPFPEPISRENDRAKKSTRNRSAKHLHPTHLC